ncbi:MAG TPA: DUF1501 domain-containing protein, partial [Polyangiaceae bacterium]|nr:DUF1501 domain-containing protein [Polyangiaceae bacterium]
GFDTHANHDRDQVRQIYKLWGGLAYILDQLDTFGLGQNTFVVVSSDFARGPRYNGENTNSGKDHWPVTSTLVLGPGIEGNRVIGGSTADQLALKLNPGNLSTGSDGVKLTPTVIHRALRGLAKLDPDLEKRFPLAGEALPLFA